MPRSPCLEAGCPNLATARGRCDEHRRERERERSRRRRAERGPRIYGTKKWQVTRKRKLAMNPICEACEKELAVEVDHIVPLGRGGDPYSLEGLSSLCSPRHWAKTAAENRLSAQGRV
jgi:5-methylcytosine-specific restriction protein A